MTGSVTISNPWLNGSMVRVVDVTASSLNSVDIDSLNSVLLSDTAPTASVNLSNNTATESAMSNSAEIH